MRGAYIKEIGKVTEVIEENARSKIVLVLTRDEKGGEVCRKASNDDEG